MEQLKLMRKCYALSYLERRVVRISSCYVTLGSQTIQSFNLGTEI